MCKSCSNLPELQKEGKKLRSLPAEKLVAALVRAAKAERDKEIDGMQGEQMLYSPHEEDIECLKTELLRRLQSIS